MESYGPAALRLTLGAMFVAHGMQKLFGLWGGLGIHGTAAYFESLGLAPGTLLAVAAGALELGGGLMLVAGVLTRYAAIALAIAAIAAFWKVHLANGLFLSATVPQDRGEGIEYRLVVFAGLVCLMFTGAGAFSVDESRARSAEADALRRARLRSKL
jgi:putative oxidoreductase